MGQGRDHSDVPDSAGILKCNLHKPRGFDHKATDYVA